MYRCTVSVWQQNVAFDKGRACRVDLPGGPLHVEWREADNHVFMTGPAELVFSGTLSL